MWQIFFKDNPRRIEGEFWGNPVGILRECWENPGSIPGKSWKNPIPKNVLCNEERKVTQK
jgi:hypothetical protein